MSEISNFGDTALNPERVQEASANKKNVLLYRNTLRAPARQVSVPVRGDRKRGVGRLTTLLAALQQMLCAGFVRGTALPYHRSYRLASAIRVVVPIPRAASARCPADHMTPGESLAFPLPHRRLWTNLRWLAAGDWRWAAIPPGWPSAFLSGPDAPAQPFTAPAVSPSTIYFCARMNMRIAGRMVSVMKASTSCQAVEYSP